MVMLVSTIKSFYLNAPVLSQELTSAKVKSMETRVKLFKINPALVKRLKPFAYKPEKIFM